MHQTAVREPAAPVDATPRGMKILAVDDSPSSLLMLYVLLSEDGHKVLTAASGEEAVRLFAAEPPDLVLMDVVMPGMDGYEAAARIKALCGRRWVPVIFLSALSDEAGLVRGLEVGGDDYLTKPVSAPVLKAKIRSMHRVARMQAQLLESERRLRSSSEALQRFYDEAQQEHEMAKGVMDRMIERRGLADPRLHFHVEAAQRFSGDLVAAARCPSGLLHVLLADATGHGLPAAITVIPVLQIFYGMVGKGLPLPVVVTETNSRLKALMPADRYLAATLLVVDEARREARIWNGGMPEGFFLHPDGTVGTRFRSRHMPLGILPEADFDSAVETFAWQAPGQFLFYSDGVIEAENLWREAFGGERLLAVAASCPPQARLAHVRDNLARFLGGTPAHDDMSLVLVDAP